MEVTKEQKGVVDSLISGELTLKQFNAMRSNSRRMDNLIRSCELSVINEIYKQEIKDDKSEL